jgi:hypothetical protein
MKNRRWNEDEDYDYGDGDYSRYEKPEYCDADESDFNKSYDDIAPVGNQVDVNEFKYTDVSIDLDFSNVSNRDLAQVISAMHNKDCGYDAKERAKWPIERIQAFYKETMARGGFDNDEAWEKWSDFILRFLHNLIIAVAIKFNRFRGQGFEDVLQNARASICLNLRKYDPCFTKKRDDGTIINGIVPSTFFMPSIKSVIVGSFGPEMNQYYSSMWRRVERFAIDELGYQELNEKIPIDKLCLCRDKNGRPYSSTQINNMFDAKKYGDAVSYEKCEEDGVQFVAPQHSEDEGELLKILDRVLSPIEYYIVEQLCMQPKSAGVTTMDVLKCLNSPEARKYFGRPERGSALTQYKLQQMLEHAIAKIESDREFRELYPHECQALIRRVSNEFTNGVDIKPSYVAPLSDEDFEENFFGDYDEEDGKSK